MAKAYGHANLGELNPEPICAGDGCLDDVAPGSFYCWRCIKNHVTPDPNYQAKAAKHADERARRLAAKLRPRLYAIAWGSSVKFGITVDVKTRLSELQVASPDALELLGHVGCDRQLERDVHALCAAQRLRGEWFRRVDTAATVERLIIDGDVLEIYRLVGRQPPWIFS